MKIYYNASYIYPSKSQPFQCKIRQINRIVSFLDIFLDILTTRNAEDFFGFAFKDIFLVLVKVLPFPFFVLRLVEVAALYSKSTSFEIILSPAISSSFPSCYERVWLQRLAITAS